MSLQYTHNPNYFLFAQLLSRHIQQYVQKHPDAHNAIFDLRDIYDLFQQDFASTTTNLEGILHIVDEYRIEDTAGDQKIISAYQIDVENNKLLIDFNPQALASLRAGKPFIAPDASVIE